MVSNTRKTRLTALHPAGRKRAGGESGETRLNIMTPAEKITAMLKSIDTGNLNAAGHTYINIMKNEFIVTGEEFFVPHIPVKELDYGSAVPVVEYLTRYIPEYLLHHELMVNRQPVSDQHSLQFAMKVPGKLIDFLHFFKVNLKYGGGAGRVVSQGGTDRYPSYYTDHVYFKSRLIPQHPGSRTDNGVFFSPLRVFASTYTESDQYFHSFAVFEDIKAGDITREMHERLGYGDIFPISLKLYPFIEYDFFTFALNVLYPERSEIETAAGIFEPLFILIYSRYNDITGLFPQGLLPETFSDSLVSEGGSLSFTDGFLERLRDYFSRFSIFRDDDLALKGWWRIDRKRS